jgi:dipeptidyl aminopeptidase/acylaminoacyl peptidase
MAKSWTLIALISVIIVGSAAYWLSLDRTVNEEKISNFSECVAAGNAVMESYPRQCRSEAGELFVEEIDVNVDSTGDETIHPVSLEALMNKNLVGSDFVVGEVLDDNNAYTRYYITYRSNGLLISGIMNVPKGDGPFPLLILNHGYIDPAIYTNGRGLKREQDYLVRRGYVVIHPDYRNHAQSDKDPDNEINFRLGYTEDVINTVNAIEQANLSYVDTTRVGMLGHSMGGGITLNTLVVEPQLVDAAVLFAPVSANYVRNYERWTERDSETGQRIIELYGSPEENPDFWNGVSAKNYFDNIVTPIQNHHGTEDESVELKWSDELETWLDETNKELEYYIYEGEPHEFINAWPLVMSRTVTFFDEHVKNKN